MKKLILLITLFALPTLSFAQQPGSGHLKSGFEADGLDLWELAPGTDVQAAINAFAAKCSTEIPARIKARISSIDLDVEQFQVDTNSYPTFVPGYGVSYRCWVTSLINPRSEYRFGEWKASDIFMDLTDNNGNVIQSSVEQCKDYIASIEESATGLKLFDRHALLSWSKARGQKMISSCYVTYLQIVTRN